ncbi:hypothetical protein LENED_001332 [Lentinula edodes]|uniref:Uncharacterized protein n=1 Tax=Lentinula edodes TaxID=5353 RepID=A0A1Q3DYM4_LENED|nr:hypothetical protein LENED_001332 [Lentinula edodes]
MIDNFTVAAGVVKSMPRAFIPPLGTPKIHLISPLYCLLLYKPWKKKNNLSTAPCTLVTDTLSKSCPPAVDNPPQPQRRAASESPPDPPPHFDLDTGDHDDQDPPVDPDDHDDLDDDSGGLPRGEPGDPSGPGGPGGPGGSGGPGGPRSPISPDIPNEQRAMLELLSGFKGSIETLAPFLLLSADLPTALNLRVQDNFGVYDAQGEAEDSLGNLKMKETENIRKYNIRFNTLAASTNGLWTRLS